MITSLQNPKIKYIVSLRDNAKERAKVGIYIAEGFKMFEEAPLEDISEVYISENIAAQNHMRTPIWEKLERTGYETLSPEAFGKVSDTQGPQGLLTLMRMRTYRLEELLSKPDPILAVIEDLQDPGNLGTILRTGEGAGITGVILSKETVDIYNPKTIRSTMGSIYRVPFVYVEDLQNTIIYLHSRGVITYGALLSGTACYDKISYLGPAAFLIGNEARGLSKSTADLVKFPVRIPMQGSVESLNASVAAAILMYEAYRQRRCRHEA